MRSVTLQDSSNDISNLKGFRTFSIRLRKDKQTKTCVINNTAPHLTYGLANFHSLANVSNSSCPDCLALAVNRGVDI